MSMANTGSMDGGQLVDGQMVRGTLAEVLGELHAINSNLHEALVLTRGHEAEPTDTPSAPDPSDVLGMARELLSQSRDAASKAGQLISVLG
jgi:hypothetical protein